MLVVTCKVLLGALEWQAVRSCRSGHRVSATQSPAKPLCPIALVMRMGFSGADVWESSRSRRPLRAQGPAGGRGRVIPMALLTAPRPIALILEHN